MALETGAQNIYSHKHHTAEVSFFLHLDRALFYFEHETTQPDNVRNLREHYYNSSIDGRVAQDATSGTLFFDDFLLPLLQQYCDTPCTIDHK